jgi:Protein of unknown function (DUF2846)
VLKINKSENDRLRGLIPGQGKSLVYIVRPSMVGMIMPFRVYCNGVDIGSTHGKKFLFIHLNPGRYEFVTEKREHGLTLDALPDTTYYVVQKMKMGLVVGHVQYELITNEKKAYKLLYKCKISSDHRVWNM